MAVEVKVNTLPESVEEGTLMDWQKQEGEAVKQDEKLVDIETDKIVIEVAAPSDGVLSKIHKESGATVKADEVLAEIDPEAEASAPSGDEAAEEGAGAEEPEGGDKAGEDGGEEKEKEKKKEKAREDAPAETAGQDEKKTKRDEEESEEKRGEKGGKEADQGEEQEGEAERAEEPGGAEHEPPPLSPAVRKLIEEHDLNVDHIMGTGRDGRITKADVLRHIEAAATPDVPRPEKSQPQYNLGAGEAESPAREPSPATPARPQSAAGRTEQRVPMTRLRRRVAERLVQVQQEAAVLTTFNEINMQAVVNLRRNYQEEFQKEYDVKLGFMSFFVKAAVEALKKYPLINASIDGNDILYHDYYDIGIAVSSPRGLVVPVIRDADQAGLGEIEQRIIDFAKRSQEGQLELEELQGGTFTITNGGVFGSMLSTPIINPPQSGILGMHSIQQRPVAEDGNVVIRPMMYVALSYDHRIVDGREAVSFLVMIKKLLEEPGRFLLNL